MTAELAFVLATAYTGLAMTTFTVVFHLLARWWRSRIGVNQMILFAGLAATFDLALFMMLAHAKPPVWLVWLGTFLYVAVGSAAWWRLGIMVRAQRENQPDHLPQVDTNTAE